MTLKSKRVLLIAILICILDQATKWIVVKTMPFGQKVTVWENFFDIVHVRNRGAAFGVLSQWDSHYRDYFFYLLFVFAFVFLYSFFKQIPDEKKYAVVPVGLIFGGAVGNVLDRVFRGSVVDFLSFHWYDERVEWMVFGRVIQFDLTWPAFNVADSAISVGVAWLFLMMFFQKGEKDVSLSH